MDPVRSEFQSFSVNVTGRHWILSHMNWILNFQWNLQNLLRNINGKMSSDEENDELQDLEEIRDRFMSIPRSERMQVSAWEDDNDGIEAQRNPEG